jgi:TRAP-type uncharacterized transport system fused permease subunit
MSENGQPLGWAGVPGLIWAVMVAALGIFSLAISIAGYFKTTMPMTERGLALLAAMLMLIPRLEIAGMAMGLWVNLIGIGLFSIVVVLNTRRSKVKHGEAVA